jgi:hypothetical protein
MSADENPHVFFQGDEVRAVDLIFPPLREPHQELQYFLAATEEISGIC